MKYKKLLIGFSCVAMLLTGCGKKAEKVKEDKWDTTEEHDVESPFVELPSNENYTPKVYSEEESDLSYGTLQASATIGDLDNFYVNPMRYVITTNEIIFRKGSQNAIRDKAIVYTADWRYRTTPQRDESVKEYAIELNENKQYEVTEVSNETGTYIPINGFVVSLPATSTVSFDLNQVVDVVNFTIPKYKSAVYNQDGVRRTFLKINETYFWSTATGSREYHIAAFFDSKAPSSLIPYPNMPINYIHFSFDENKNAFTPDYFRNRTQDSATTMNIDEEGFLLVNAASSTVPYTALLEEGALFNKGDSIYFENVPHYFKDDVVLKIGQPSQVNENVAVTTRVYRDAGSLTGANEWSYEVSVVNDRVVSKSVNEVVPNNGYVLSFQAANGATAENTMAPLQDLFTIGTKVSIENGEVIVHCDALDLAPSAVQDAINQTQKYIDLRNNESYDYDAKSLTKIQAKMVEIYTKMQKYDESKLTNPTLQYYYVNMLNAILAQLNHAMLNVSGSHEPVYNQGLWAYPYESTLEQLQMKLDWYKASNMNEIIVGPIEDGYATYDSKILPKVANYDANSRDYGKYGKDYLKAVIGEAHKRGMKVQVVVNNWSHWKGVVEKYPEFNDYFALNTRGELIQDTLDGPSQYLDPANAVVQEFYLKVYEELLKNYDIDALQLDGIRYGASSDALATSQGITEAARVGFNEFLLSKGYKIQYNDMKSFISGLSGQFTLFNEYRRQVVTKFVARCHELTHRYNVILTAAVVAGLEYARRAKLQAWDEWAQTGIIDGIYLMAYYLDKVYVEKTTKEAYEACGSQTFVAAGIAPVFLAIPNMELSLELKDVDDYGAVGGTIFANHSYGGRTDVEYYLNGRYGGAFDNECVTTYDKISKTMQTMMNAILRRSLFIYQDNNQQTTEQYNALVEEAKKIKSIANGKENTATIDKLIAELTVMFNNAESYASSYAVTRIRESINYTIHIAKLYYTYYSEI